MRWTLGDLVRRPQSVALREFLFQVHLWLGLCVGLYVFAIGLSGAMLVFRPELQARAFPQFFHAAHRTDAGANTQSLLNSLTVAYPGERVSGLDWPTYRRKTVLAYVMNGSDFRTVFLDPWTAAVIGGLPQHSWISTLQNLHSELLAGSTGRTANGVGALCLALMVGTGLCVWWPGIERWRQSLRLDFRRGWKRAIWHVHGAVGFWVCAVLLLWALTGAEFIFPRPFRAAVNALSPLTLFVTGSLIWWNRVMRRS